MGTLTDPLPDPYSPYDKALDIEYGSLHHEIQEYDPFSTSNCDDYETLDLSKTLDQATKAKINEEIIRLLRISPVNEEGKLGIVLSDLAKELSLSCELVALWLEEKWWMKDNEGKVYWAPQNVLNVLELIS